MILKKKKYLWIRLYIILFYFIIKVYLIELKLSNDEESMNTLASRVNDLQTMSIYNEIKLLLNEDYYLSAKNSKNNFMVNTILTFQSDNGTTIDFQKSFKSVLSFDFSANSLDKKVIFRNITFYNYSNVEKTNKLLTFTFPAESSNYQVIFENCIFEDIYYEIFYFDYSNLYFTNNPQVYFNNCTFM